MYGGSSKRSVVQHEIARWNLRGKQIGNACGSIGLLHALLNLPSDGPYALKPDSHLVKFKQTSLPLGRELVLFL